ncbi:unnamed protein product [Mytilus coruscus]|uniref:Uncharacterized protein n=1 Tax=Mytilus coruscus TaxID=42192 RepID=A0A6J8DTI3_MYTCO|nr:unnamed protein product [Mytilus coruscus]
MEIELFHLWLRCLELQRDKLIAVTEREEERRKRTRRRRQQTAPINLALYNLHRKWNPSIVPQAIDHEDEHNQLQPSKWRKGRHMADGDHTYGRNAVASTGVRQLDYLKHYFNSPAGSETDEWQESSYLVQQCNYTVTYLWFHRETAGVVILVCHLVLMCSKIAKIVLK